MKRMRKLWAMLLLCPILSVAVVREVGPGKTHATINNALIFANNGDEIVIYPSTYTEGLLSTSAADHNLIIRGTDTNTVILLGTSFDVGGTNVMFANLQIKNWGVNGARGINAENVNFLKVSNCFFHFTTDAVFANDVMGVRTRNSTGHLILSNTFVGTPNVSAGLMKGMNIVSALGSGTNWVSGVRILGNLVKDHGGDGIDIHGEGLLVQGNQILDNVDSFGTSNHSDGIQLIKATLDGKVNVEFAWIDQNIIRNSTQNVYVEGFVPGGGGQVRNIWVTRNVVYNSAGTVNGYNMDGVGNKLVGIIGGSNVWVYHNTLGRHSNNAILVQDSVNGTVHIVNNIFQNDANQSIYYGVYFEAVAGQDVGTLNHNMFHSPNGAGYWKIHTNTYTTLANIRTNGWELQGQIANPLISAWPTPTIASNSPAIDAGFDFTTQMWSNDLAGVSAPRGAGWDIGAYEFASAGGPPPGPSPQEEDDIWRRLIFFFFPMITPLWP